MGRYIEEYQDGVQVSQIDRATLLTLAEAKREVLWQIKASVEDRVYGILPKEIVDVLQTYVSLLILKEGRGTITPTETTDLQQMGAFLLPITVLARKALVLLNQVQTETDIGAVLDTDIDAGLT